jgi:hypothetical protein
VLILTAPTEDNDVDGNGNALLDEGDDIIFVSTSHSFNDEAT